MADAAVIESTTHLLSDFENEDATGIKTQHEIDNNTSKYIYTFRSGQYCNACPANNIDASTFLFWPISDTDSTNFAGHGMLYKVP